ncbi:NAF1-domain-containing protein [Hypoxylon cercidicola]|nr:NAF1-domain-containing protein [Hypoxylon cercidicola]
MSGLADIPGLAPLPGPEEASQGQPTALSSATQSTQNAAMENKEPEDVDMAIHEAPPSPPSLTSGLEAILGGLDPLPQESITAPAQPNTTQQDGQSQEQNDQSHEQGEPEWEADSSPYESSSDSSSSDDSDEDSEDGKNYELLGPEETARILMEMDGGSDDEGDGKTKGSGSGAQVRTKNELPEEVVPKPDVVITSDMELIELGSVEHIVESTVVVKANTTGEYRVLDSGSVLATENRTVIAAVADLIGNVLQPRYTARFTNDDEIKAFGLELGTKVFYTPKHASYVFTQALRQQKGTDASNWHDEEPADDEMEFSDDEKEAEYKRQQKAKKKGGRGGRGGAAGRGDHDASSSVVAPEVSSLKYDDDDDGPYRKLARPASLAQGASAPPESGYTNNYAHRGGSSRGGRGRGQRGHHGRGGYDNRGNRGARSGHSLPPRPPRGQEYQQSQPQQFNYPSTPAQTAPTMPYNAAPQFYGAANGQQGHQVHPQPTPQFPFAWPQNMPQGFVPPPPPQFTGQPTGNNMAFYNQDFIQTISQMQSQMHPQQNPQGQQRGEWPGFGGAG